MRISAFFPRRELGFSLPELLVVLAIVSLSFAIVIPNLESFMGAIQRNLEKKQINELVNNLGNLASSRGLMINAETFEDDGPLSAYFPEGYSVTGDFSYLPNGVCTGGNISITRYQKKSLETSLLPPFCKVSND